MREELHGYLAKHSLLDAEGLPLLESFDDAMAGMFTHTGTTVQTIRDIRALHSTYPSDKVKACVVILVYPIHCGENCIAPMSEDR